MGNKPLVARLSRSCAASPEVVYDMLADLPSHLSWGGSQQRSDFRLLTLEAPAGPAGVGTVFTTTGAIPMSRKRWDDRSTVTVAARPMTFEFETESQVGVGKRSMRARFVNRYELSRSARGCEVTYTQTQLEIANPMLRLALPPMRWMMWRIGIPMFESRGFRNLIRGAERLAATHAETASVGVSRGAEA